VRRVAIFRETMAVNTRKHRDLSWQEIGLFGLTADADFDATATDQSIGGLGARISARLDAWLPEEAPDRLLVQRVTSGVVV